MTDTPESYSDFNENGFVESLGGRDLMAPKDDVVEKVNNENITNPYYVDDNSFEEQRRVASLQTAQSLGLTNVGELLNAASEIEKYLKGESNS